MVVVFFAPRAYWYLGPRWQYAIPRLTVSGVLYAGNYMICVSLLLLLNACGWQFLIPQLPFPPSHPPFCFSESHVWSC